MSQPQLPALPLADLRVTSLHKLQEQSLFLVPLPSFPSKGL